ncbi:hypothetical protein TNCT_180101 [Trichonephila clavata]|uniref:Uncharacterized protein n=1 Tax=Trichonephila clavata TaxID=2740835 RepID=A0A8X6FCR9_TRICU|nr:hypothetical protein TNCT_180101 [Trichonephila clavata]
MSRLLLIPRTHYCNPAGITPPEPKMDWSTEKEQPEPPWNNSPTEILLTDPRLTKEYTDPASTTMTQRNYSKACFTAQNSSVQYYNRYSKAPQTGIRTS